MNCSLKSDAGTFSGQILKLTQVGFIVDIGSVVPRAGDRFEISFELPVLHHVISSGVTVIKTYNQMGGAAPAAAPGAPTPPSSNLACRAEMHFRALNESDKEKLHHFLQIILKTLPR